MRPPRHRSEGRHVCWQLDSAAPLGPSHERGSGLRFVANSANVAIA